MASPDPTELILRIFRLNGALLVAGDRLVGGLGLTSARWQLLGEISGCDEPVSVAQLARQMGNSRQAVQRITNELSAGGLVSFRTNPCHKRAQLVALTDRGRELFERSLALQRPWARDLVRSLTSAQLHDACATLDGLLDALKASFPSTVTSNPAQSSTSFDDRRAPALPRRSPSGMGKRDNGEQGGEQG